MKKTLLLCLTLLLTGLCAAQTTEEVAFQAKDQALTKELFEAVQAKDYAAAERCCQQQLLLFDAQIEPVCEKFAFFRMGHYYNLACMQSLQGKRKAALQSFVLACENGYDDYGHVQKDTDLDNIRSDKEFRRLHEAMRATSDFLHILQTASGYTPGQTDSLPHFSYQSPNDRDLVCVRTHFKLDSEAGAGDELSKIRNLLTFVHNTIRHDGQHGNPPSMNSIALAEACKEGSRGLNCRGLATVLNECYLALGFPSRVVTCLPAKYIADCHVISAESPADRGDYPNYTLLYPEGFTPDYPRNMMPKYSTTNDDRFWQSPYKE